MSNREPLFPCRAKGCDRDTFALGYAHPDKPERKPKSGYCEDHRNHKDRQSGSPEAVARQAEARALATSEGISFIDAIVKLERRKSVSKSETAYAERVAREVASAEAEASAEAATELNAGIR